MKQESESAEYSPKEELANWLTHGVALLFSVLGVCLLFFEVSFESGVSRWLSAVVYSVSLVLLYSASTVYHWVRSPKWKHVFRILDHSAIYIKIAGTYTPFLILALKDYHGWELLMIMWGITIMGILFKTLFVNRFNLLSTGLYLTMGWIVIVMIKPLYHSLSLDIFLYLMAGGFSFTVGVIFYLWKRLRYGHSVWHTFVVAGSAFHFVSVYLLITAN